MARDLTSPEVFEELVREHQAMVFRTLSRLTGRVSQGQPGGNQVEDLAQEVFLRLYRALPEFRGDSAVSTYLYRIVLNVAQDEWKRRRKERARTVHQPATESSDDQPWLENFSGDELAGQHARSPEQHMLDAQVESCVNDALQELPEHERAVLVLYHQDECSYEGIAAVLNVPVNTVRTHLHRGRKRMAELVRARMRSPARMPGDMAQAALPQQRAQLEQRSGTAANTPLLKTGKAEA